MSAADRYLRHSAGRVLRIFALIFLACGSALLTAAQDALPSLPIDLAVTNGLVRWWPNLFDARDEISGQEGVVMGVLPPVDTGVEDETEFSQHTAWVHLQPAITNEVFTLSFWLLLRSALYCNLLGQESGEGGWCFQSLEDTTRLFIGSLDITPEDRLEHVDPTLGKWHHVAIARRTDGTSLVWVDGVRALDGRLPHPWPVNGRWLNAGNMMRALDSLYSAMLRDLCAFDRVLTDSETRALHAAGLPRRPARNTTARLRATARNVPMEVSTNVVVTTPQTWTHRRFTTEDGLPGNIVKAVLQARNGYLWVGTEAGLARFDGRQFRTFTTENTPALKAIGENVYSLSQDADGDIWAGIFGGLLRIRGLEFTSFTNGLPQRFVLQAEPAGDGSLWVAGFNSFVPRGPLWLRRYHPDSGTSSAEVVVPGHIRRIIAATNGVWLVTEQPQMMLRWDGRAAAPTVVGTVGHEPPAVGLNSMAPKTDLRAWRSGLTNWWAEAKFGGDGPAFHWLWDTRLLRPWAARWNGPLADDQWLGVTHDLARLRGGHLEKIDVANGAAGPEISSLCANREGGVWFGTEEDGLHFVQERLIRVFTTQDGLGGNDVRAVCATSDGGLFVATAGGLNHYQKGVWTPQSQGRMRSVASDREGRAWLGGQGGGQLQLRRDRRVEQSNKNVVLIGLEWHDPNTLRFAIDGTLWVVCEGGLTWLKPERLVQNSDEIWLPDPASTEPVYGRYAVGNELPKMFPLGLIEDGDGSVWLGSLANGLFHVTNGRVENFSEKDGLPGNHCVPVYRDDAGALWIVSDGGLSRRLGGQFQNIGEKDGLPKDVLLDLIEDDLGNFWVSGKRGIHRVIRRELEEFFAGRLNRVHSLTLGARDGLLTPECASLHYPTMAKMPDGHIWVATRNGLATFDPRRVRLDTQPLPAVIEQLVVNRREVPLRAGGTGDSPVPSGDSPDGTPSTPKGSQTVPLPRSSTSIPLGESPSAAGGSPALPTAIRLPPGSGERLEVHYTAISLVAADRVKFRHRLDGYDSDWSRETDLRLAFFTNLRPGAYQFRVKAANAHGVWNDRETTLSFVIQPYFWQTRTFYSAMGGAIVALAAGVHRRRLSGQRRIQELKHEQAFTSEKARIAADMHDELGAALTQIAILGEVAKSQAGNHGQTGSTLDRISQAARDVTARMSELVWATNPRNDTLDNLLAYLREHAASQLESTAIQPRLEFPSSFPEGRVSAMFRRNLVLVLKESLNNLIKHAKATEVSVKVEIAGSNLVLRIRDNGRGFEPAARNGTGNGLGNMQKRVRDLGGDFSLRSAPGQGTCVEISVPLNSQS